jgi:hypothetical protein
MGFYTLLSYTQISDKILSRFVVLFPNGSFSGEPPYHVLPLPADTIQATNAAIRPRGNARL